MRILIIDYQLITGLYWIINQYSTGSQLVNQHEISTGLRCPLVFNWSQLPVCQTFNWFFDLGYSCRDSVVEP